MPSKKISGSFEAVDPKTVLDYYMNGIIDADACKQDYMHDLDLKG